jgi:hypothetical protein
MNERIRELVKSAEVAHEQEGILLPFVLEKFALLIILECAAYAEYAKGDTDVDYQKYFKGRFGVE